jgi:hypothetical protein
VDDNEVAERLLEALERIADSLEVISFYLERKMTEPKSSPSSQTH